MKKQKVTFADIAAYTHFPKPQYPGILIILIPSPWKTSRKSQTPWLLFDYKENKVGRILASGRTEFVGIIIPNLYMQYYSEMLNQILATYETYGL